MKYKILITFLFFLFSNFCFAQEKELKEYSYSEFFELIKKEKDSVFELSDARIKFNPETDSLFSSSGGGLFSTKKTFRTDTLYIDKILKLKSVFFDWRGKNGIGLLNHIVFQKKAYFTNVSLAQIDNCIFKETVYFNDTEDFYKEVESFNNTVVGSALQVFFNCRFEKGIYWFYDENLTNGKIDQWFGIFSSEIINRAKEGIAGSHSRFESINYEHFTLQDNIFRGPKKVYITLNNITRVTIENNDFSPQVRLEIPEENAEYVSINGNIFEYPTLLEWNNYSGNYSIGWDQFENGIINNTSYFNFFDYQNPINPKTQEPFTNREKRSSEGEQYYLNSVRIRNRSVFKEELKVRSKFLNMYREQYDNEFGNMVYTEIKDLETERLAYLNQVEPSFKNFFTWKINQFLKVFSAYGTEPARAIVYSVYVILFFALIYLFFPNSWDRYGRNRIMARYSFFIKYMKKDAGIHKLHLENRNPDLMEYEEFKNLVVSSKKNIPNFFYATALPLYKWSVSGTKFSASLLKRVDVMKGKWEELPAHKRLWKSVLLVGAFLIAVLYDIFVKMLNALMLSINTFTTLGFGEIPIKGLPRYLAIIEGFIGWFMLTIFSVSLISQLLN